MEDNKSKVSKPTAIGFTESYHYTIPIKLNCYINHQIGKPFNKEIVIANLMSIIGSGNPTDSHKIKLSVYEKDGFVSVKACNLYTFLQMSGVPIKYHVVEHMDEFYTPDGLYKHSEIKNYNGEVVDWINEFTPSNKLAELRKKRYNHND